MIKTLRQVISTVVDDLKSVNLDDRFSYRFIGRKLTKRIETVLKQDSVDRTIFNINEIWKPLKCIELKDVPLSECSYDSCETIKKSCKPIPKVYTGKYGNYIKILNVKNSMEYKQCKPFEYKDIKNRQFQNKKIKYFWIEEDYLFIPDSDVEDVKGFGLFKDSQEADFFNGTVDCCFKPLDSELLIPDYIIDIAIKDVVSELRQINKTLPQDTNPNQAPN